MDYVNTITTLKPVQLTHLKLDCTEFTVFNVSDILNVLINLKSLMIHGVIEHGIESNQLVNELKNQHIKIENISASDYDKVCYLKIIL